MNNETKNKNRHCFLSLWMFGLLLLLLGGCNSVDCPMNNTVYTVYNFMQASGEADTLTDSLSIITKRRVPDQDPVLVNRAIGLSSLTVPISYDGDEDVFFFCFKDTVDYYAIDTVSVKKINRPHLESVDCNPSYFHTITEVTHTHNMIDSIVINNPEVNYDSSKEHFHIYLHSRP